MLLDGSTIVDLANAVSLTQTLVTDVAKCSVSNSSYDMALYRYLLADMPQIIYPPLAHKV